MTPRGDTMTDTMAAEFTEEQRAEWNALMDEVRKLTEESRDMEREAGSTLAWSLRHPGNEDFAMKQALEEAQRAVDLWARREELRAQADANPYSAVVRARIAERKEAEASR